MTERWQRPSQGALNLPELLVRVDNDRDLLRELIEIFKVDFPVLLKQLQSEIIRREMGSIENTSHALKGMLSGLAAMPAASIASAIEQMARGGDGSGLSEAVTNLEREFERLLPELDASVREAQS